jgi:16S rRNA (cytosine1402-N4)-methyltransferase
MTTDHHIHIPVLQNAVLEYLAPEKGDSYLDATAGYGGHAGAVLERTLNDQASVLVDRDHFAVKALQQAFAGRDVTIMQQDFYHAAQALQKTSKQFDMILADLGVSSAHLDNASRGFSVTAEGPLDMRMDSGQTLTAAELVNNGSEEELADILRTYGEEPKARRIARLIAENRPVHTTSELAHIVARAWPGHSRVHPATRTFQALRIAVNNELELLKKTLPLWVALLKPGGRLAVISFHSLEDRIVKRFLQEHSDHYEAELHLLTKKPVTPGQDELVLNPRARSAKLRAAVKINTKKKGR